MYHGAGTESPSTPHKALQDSAISDGDAAAPGAAAPPAPGALARGITARWTCRAVGDRPVAIGDAPLVSRVLAARGIRGDEAGQRFLTPSLKHLHDPGLLPGLERAAARLLDAARAGEPIVVYGDYDVDGVSAAAILWRTLRAVAPACSVSTYVPHRLEEGYGLNAEALRELARHGARVIVSVDCGITAVEPARAALDAGADLIITDHHNLPAGAEEDPGLLPPAYALVHPRLPGSAYPFPDLCGAGVAFKLAWRLATMAAGSERVGDALRDLLLDNLALASLGVVADVVPLVGENRVIARFGLSRLRTCGVEGVRALVAASGLDGDRVSEEDVGFRLGPRLNACGRLGHAREAVELLTTATGERCRAIAEDLTRLNDERRATEKRIFEEAKVAAEREGMTRDDRRAIVLASEHWHQGVVGIVCSRLVEAYHRPAILMQTHDGVCHGSGRSVEGFSLHAALERCAPLLEKFGGHDMAAGVRVRAERLGEFREAFTEIANARIGVDELCDNVEYDAEASAPELTTPVVRSLERLGPFGRDNPSVALRLSGVRVFTHPETFGKDNSHLRLRVQQGGSVLRLTGWGWACHARPLSRGRTVDVVVAPRINTWNGAMNVEGELLDAMLTE